GWHHERTWLADWYLEQPRRPGPAVLGPQDRHRLLRRVGVGHDAAFIEILGGLLDLNVADQGGDHRLVEVCVTSFLDRPGAELGEDHWGRHDGVPVAQDQRVDPIVGQAVADRVL